LIKRTLLFAVSLLLATTDVRSTSENSLPLLRVSENKRFLVTESGKPFFYLADTGWELFHRLDRKQALYYLDVRAAQGFNVIQAVVLGEMERIDEPNAYGKLALVNADPTKPATTPGADPTKPGQYDYWDHIDFIIDQANARGIYIALLPTWGHFVNGTEEFRPVLTKANAQTYGEFLGRRYGRKGVIWIMGGDRNPIGYEETWRALARGVAIGVSGREDYDAVLMSFHPNGAATSSTWFHHEPWLDFNMQQDGHAPESKAKSWVRMSGDYDRTPTKPVLDGEPVYEDHPLDFKARELGYSFDAHVRQFAYADTFSGACGHTYGNHAVWQMYAAGHEPVNGPLMYWDQAIHRPGAGQMRFVKALFESRPYLSRIPDQSIVVDALEGADRISATRGDGYLFVYSAQGRKFAVRLDRLDASNVQGWWYNPRTGSAQSIGQFDNDRQTRLFVPPSEGFGSDWVLVLDDAVKGFREPGRVEVRK
jgi:hypothetical protein